MHFEVRCTCIWDGVFTDAVEMFYTSEVRGCFNAQIRNPPYCYIGRGFLNVHGNPGIGQPV